MATIKSKQQKITPCLWFDRNGEEAANFYTSVFRNSKMGAVTHYPEGAPMPKGTAMTISFQLEGQDFLALNGGPYFKFSEAVSFIVYCKTQKEIDYYWDRLSKGGKKVECGWLKDKFGLSWQIVPEILTQIFEDKKTEKSLRAVQAIWKMKKINIKAVKKAYHSK